MKKTECYDRDIYFVEEDENGKKQINVQRYYYNNGDGDMVTEYVGVRLQIPTTNDELESATENANQYVGSVTESELKADIDDCNPLPIEKVTTATPCGKYIN